MSQAFKTNPRAAWLIVAAITALAITSILSACQIQDIVRVDVPAGIQQAIDLEPRISVSDSGAAWEEWVAWVDRNSSRFSDEIDRGQATAGLIASLTDTGLALGKDAASTLPGGAFISTGLALMGGLFLKRPGDKAKERAEAEKSYNAGLEKGQRISTSVLAGIESLKESQGGGKS
tara:strand:- start:105 stop:632 length:528 start_codon:yes stop_codon:yes gene_type:complete